MQEKKCHNLENVHFEKKCPKIKKHNFPLMTTFYNFTLKIKTSCAKNVIKSILKFEMTMMVFCMFGFFYFRIKKYAL